jgi:hypothetical protein
MEDILSVLPFQSGVIFMKIRGEHLLEALEESVRFYDMAGIEAPGRFLQYSGITQQSRLLRRQKLCIALHTLCLLTFFTHTV